MTNEQREYGGDYVKCTRCGVSRPPKALKDGVCLDAKGCAESAARAVKP